MAGKPVEAVERLAVEGEGGHVENEPRIVSPTPRGKPSPQPVAWIVIVLLTTVCIHSFGSFQNRRIRQTNR
jgi:hypothetical protein